MRVWHAVWQGTEGTVNPVTRPLVKSLMKVLSFLMGRRRKVVPKAMEKLKPRCGWAESAENPQMILKKGGRIKPMTEICGGAHHSEPKFDQSVYGPG